MGLSLLIFAALLSFANTLDRVAELEVQVQEMRGASEIIELREVESKPITKLV